MATDKELADGLRALVANLNAGIKLCKDAGLTVQIRKPDETAVKGHRYIEVDRIYRQSITDL